MSPVAEEPTTPAAGDLEPGMWQQPPTNDTPTPEPRERNPQRPRPLTTLIASARRLTSADIAKAGKVRRKKAAERDWQEGARDMYRQVGEYQFIVDMVSGKVGAAKLYVGKLSKEDPSNDPEQVVDNPDVVEVLNSIGGTFAGRSQLLTRLSINLMVVGDGWICGIPNHLTDPANNPKPEPGTAITLDSLDWRFMSIKEVDVNQSEVKLKLDNLSEPVKVSPDQVYLIRVWDPDPFEWWEATASSRANLPVLKELVGLTMHISAQVDSRLAGAGVFLVPQSAQSALQAAQGVDESSGTDEFTEALIESMLTPIGDRGSASAIVPLVVTAPDESIEKFRHIKFSTDLDVEARNLREETIRRLALGMDAPPEVLLGTGGANHWGSWMVSADTIQSHVEPKLALICDALTTQYLWPVLKEQEVEDAEDYVVWYDVAHLIVQPNRSQDALALHERKVISDTALRRELGFDEDDKLEEKDPVTDTILQMVSANPGMLRSPALPQMVEALQAIIKGDWAALAKEAESPAVPAPGVPAGEASGAPATAPAPVAEVPGAAPVAAPVANGVPAGASAVEPSGGAPRLPMTAALPVQGVQRAPVG